MAVIKNKNMLTIGLENTLLHNNLKHNKMKWFEYFLSPLYKQA